MISINPENCMSRKNKKNGYNQQCSYKKKFGDYCGIHHKSNKIDRIDGHNIPNIVPNLVNPNLIPKTIPKTNPKPLIILKKKNNNTVNTTNTTTNTTNKSILLDKKKFYEKEDMGNLSLSNLNHAQLVKTLQKYKINIIGSQDMLLDKLKDFFTNSYLGINPDQASSSQLRTVTNFVKYSGPALMDRSLCQNADDFFDLTSVEEIPDLYFFSFKDSKDLVYGCDIRSFQGLVESHQEDLKNNGNYNNNNDSSTSALSLKNPYDRGEIPYKVIDQYLGKKNLLFQNGVMCQHEKEELDVATQFKLRILDLFQIIYHFGYSVDHQWFLNLSTSKLHDFYFKLEDIWNYRLNIPMEVKKQIVPDNDVFFNNEKLMVKYLKEIHDYLNLAKIVVNTIEKLITKGITKADRITGSSYVLTALVEVSPPAAAGLPEFAFAAGLTD